MAHASNPSSSEAEEENGKFQANQGYMAWTYLKSENAPSIIGL
jgi:hypothetical protein